MAFWLSSPDIGERQSGHAWCMHGTSKTIVCDLWQLALTTTELSRATAAFRSSTRRLQPLKHILGGLRLHAECQNIGGFVPLLARDVRARRSLIAGSIAPSELYRTSYHRHAVDGLPRRHRYKTACLGRIGKFSETYNHLGLDPATCRARTFHVR